MGRDNNKKLSEKEKTNVEIPSNTSQNEQPWFL